jgi:hypothetical protein
MRTELDPADRRPRGIADPNEQGLFAGACRQGTREQTRADKYSPKKRLHLWPLPPSWGHYSHKRFELLLSREQSFETNTKKYFNQFRQTLSQI